MSARKRCLNKSSLGPNLEQDQKFERVTAEDSNERLAGGGFGAGYQCQSLQQLGGRSALTSSKCRFRSPAIAETVSLADTLRGIDKHFKV